MKRPVPVTPRIAVGIQSADEVAPLLAAGAGEFFAGILAGRLESSSRPATARFQFPDAAAFARAAALARAGGAPMHLVLNEPCGAEDRAAFDRLVDAARGAGADGLILGDLALLARFRREGRDTGRVAVSCMAGALNAEAFRPFVDLGADRLIVDRQTLPDEMRALAGRFPGVGVECFAFLDKCNHVDAACRAMDLLRPAAGAGALGEECLCLLARRARIAPWPAGRADGGETPATALPLAALLDHLVWRPGCVACHAPALAAAGVASLKVASRGWPLAAKVKAVAALSAALALHAAGRPPGEVVAVSRAAFRDLFGRPCGPGDCYAGFPGPASPGGQAGKSGGAATLRRGEGGGAPGDSSSSSRIPAPSPGSLPAAFHPRDAGGLTAGRLAALHAEGFSRLYAGAEFCARLQPPPERLAALRGAAAAAGLAFTLVTPPLFEAEFAAGVEALARLLAEAGPGAEVVVNDLGLFHRFRSGDFPGAVPLLGRALAGLADHADGAALVWAAGFARVETDTPGDFPARVPFRLTRHGPWRHLNFTRFCPFAEVVGGRAPGAPCGGECLGGGYVVRADGMREAAVGVGNAHYLRAEGPPRPHRAADRVVVNDLGG